MPANFTRSPTWQEALNHVIDVGAARLRVGMPARVESYDSSKQTVSVKPLLKELGLDEEGNELVESLPVINNVPLVFPIAGGQQIKMPTAAGDTVWLSFADRSLDRWKSQGGEVDPIDQRRHHLSDPIAFPMRGPNENPNTCIEITSAGIVKLGGESASDPVALATLLNTIIHAIATHTHVVASPGCTAGGTAGTAAPSAALGSYSTADVGATKVKGV